MSIVSPPIQQLQPAGLLFIAATGIIGGAAVGASTNAVNGVVSPLYFSNVLGWQDIEDVWRASIAQGILEGLVCGVMFSVVFTLVVGVVSSARCSFQFALRYMLAIAVTVYCCWVIGGLAAMGLAMLSPEFFHRAFIGVPDDFGSMLRYAWVGGSIWGEISGGLFASMIAAVLFSFHWRQLADRDRPAENIALD